MSNIDSYLHSKRESATGHTVELWRQIIEYYEKKLWHQLSLKIKEAVNDPNFCAEENLRDFYSHFIQNFQYRFNALTFIEIALIVAKTCSDPLDGANFMLSTQGAIKNNTEAEVLCLTGIADLYLKSREPNGGCPMINKVKVLLDEAQTKLDSLQGVSSVHSQYYKISSTYFREIEDYAGYYREALRYLGCVDTDSLSESEKPIQAFCLGLAALLGEDIYNFGELLAHPILDSLQNTAESWLVEFLFAFNRGDIQRFEQLRPSWSKQDDLRNNTVLLERKIRLLCLLELAFARPPTDRKISFDEIRRVCRVEMKEVEHLFMKALSKGLIKGYIDEVEKTGYVYWVQPRVLDRKQIEKMSTKISKWCKNVEGVGKFIESNAGEILIQ